MSQNASYLGIDTLIYTYTAYQLEKYRNITEFPGV